MKTNIFLSVCLVLAGCSLATAQTQTLLAGISRQQSDVRQMEYCGVEPLPKSMDATEMCRLPQPWSYGGVSIYAYTWTRWDIQHAPARDLMELASLTPAAEMREGHISMWGSEYGPLILIDNVKIRGRAALPLAAVEQMEVVPASIPACWGDTPAGAIHITTRPTLRRR